MLDIKHQQIQPSAEKCQRESDVMKEDSDRKSLWPTVHNAPEASLIQDTPEKKSRKRKETNHNG